MREIIRRGMFSFSSTLPHLFLRFESLAVEFLAKRRPRIEVGRPEVTQRLVDVRRLRQRVADRVEHHRVVLLMAIEMMEMTSPSGIVGCIG